MPIADLLSALAMGVLEGLTEFLPISSTGHLILLGELAVVTIAALPVGAVMGYGLAAAIVQTVQSEVYRFPLFVSRQAIAWAFLGVLGAALVSALIVRRRLDTLDLVAVLKIRE